MHIPPAISLADALRIGAAKQNSASAPLAPEDTASAPPAQPNVVPNIPAQAAQSATVAGLNSSAQRGKGNWTPNPDTRSNGFPPPISPADAANISAAKQDYPAAPPAPQDTTSPPPAQPNVAIPNVPVQAAQNAPVADLKGNTQPWNWTSIQKRFRMRFRHPFLRRTLCTSAPQSRFSRRAASAQEPTSAPPAQPNVAMPNVPAQAAQSAPVADLKGNTQPWNWTSIAETLSNAFPPAISLANAMRSTAAKQNSPAAPPAPEDTASFPPAQPNVATPNVPVQAAQSAPMADLNGSTQSGNRVARSRHAF